MSLQWSLVIFVVDFIKMIFLFFLFYFFSVYFVSFRQYIGKGILDKSCKTCNSLSGKQRSPVHCFRSIHKGLSSGKGIFIVLQSLAKHLYKQRIVYLPKYAPGQHQPPLLRRTHIFQKDDKISYFISFRYIQIIVHNALLLKQVYL